jgi:DNA-binding NtrC family response regulator
LNAQQFRIFVVDDEPTIAKTTSQILELQGFDAIPFSDPRHLLESCRESPPNLVISDIIMPHMTGFELAGLLKEMQPQCSVILFTGQAGVADLAALAVEQGHVLEVLSKPLHPQSLIETVRSLCESYRALSVS